jgi:hypothetical protein
MDPEETVTPFSCAPEQKPKRTKKEFLLHELKEVFSMVLYLAASLSLLGTFRALVLIQQGTNEFTHVYVVAIVEALALGKIVALAQNLKVFRAWDDRPLVWSVIFKSVLMTLIVDVGGSIEKAIFDPHLVERPLHPLMLMITHQIALMTIFIVLFIVRDLNRALGPGKLFRLFFVPRDPDPVN